MKTHAHSLNSRSMARGVTLIESMICLLLIGFGMLGLVKLQIDLTRGANMPRHQTEALRLAQQKLEALREFQVPGNAAKSPEAEDLINGNDTPDVASNTRYSRSWRVADASSDGWRLLTVQVDWSDERAVVAPTPLALQSIITTDAAADMGSIMVPAADRSLPRNLQDLSVNVPAEAIRLAGRNTGRSTMQSPGGRNSFLVFDEADGLILARCPARPTDTTNIARDCTATAAYLLQGHLSGDLPAAMPTITIDQAQFMRAPPECAVAADLNPGTDEALAGYWRYRCIVWPGDDDSNESTPPVWSGRVVVRGLPSGTVACRFSPSSSTSNNNEHPEQYSRVSGPLDHQNFWLTSSSSCPAGTVALRDS